MQHLVVAVGKADPVELQTAVDLRHRTGAGPVADVALGVQHRADLDHRGGSRLHLAVDVGQLLQRLEHQLQQVHGGDQRADADVPVHVEVRAQQEHGGG